MALQEQDDELIGVTALRAATMMGISLKQLSGWERNGLVEPQVHRRQGTRHIRVYGLHELVELSIVRQLQERGMSIPRIRRVVEAHRVEVLHPLRELRWAVEGRQMYVGFDDGNWVGGRRPRQGVMVEVINLEELRTLARRKATERDPALVGQLEQRAGTLGHKPVFAGTRTPVEAVRSYLQRGSSVEEILEAFPHLEREDVDAARRESIGA